MMIKKIITLIFVFALTTVFSQKKVITHNDYDLWKKVDDVKISNNGKLVVSTIETSTKRGDGYVEVYNTENKQKAIFFNGYNTSISFDENFVVFKKKPKYQTLRSEKKKKIKEENQSKDALFIYDVKNNKIYDSIARVVKYELPKKSAGWMVIEKFKKKKKKETKASAKKDTLNISKAYKQNYALVYSFNTKNRDTIFQIKDFIIPEKGKNFYFVTTSKAPQKENGGKKNGRKGKEPDLGVYGYNFTSGIKTVINEGEYMYDNIVTNKDGNQFAYISVKDSTAIDSLKFELYHYNNNDLIKRVGILGENLRNNWELSHKQSLSFSEDGSRLYFYTKPTPDYEKDTTLLEEEIPQVDVWHWQDKMIQPEQKSKYEELEKKSYASYYDLKKDKYIHIQQENIDNLIFDKDKNQQFILGETGLPYDIKRSWDLPWTKDYYSIDTYSGTQRLALQNAAIQPILAPDSKYALYFDINKQHWFSLNLETLEKNNLTKTVKVPFYDEENDRPMLPYPHGFGGFDAKGNALVYDKFDIWKVSLDGKQKPQNITKDGRKNNIQYRAKRLDLENKNLASYINGELLIISFNKTTKASGLYTLSTNKLIEKIKPNGFYINGYKKAENAEVFTYRKQNFNIYPDVYVTTDGFKNTKKITDANPHQDQFKWGSAELFSWKTYDGQQLEGIIYKPDNFDPSKKYPLITYFYEKWSDRYTRYSSPQPSASIVNPSYLVSNDYIMFVPDIVYKKGKPGPSAYNCVVSGVEAVEKLGYIDSNNIAIQGQSWGGYQVAYLITVTNKFKAAMAGAPVSNMTSAYGGIRWQSGLSRAFQYEKTQSRIGKNLWEGFDLYIENSPLFGIPKIETPLLMMHNDKDGAVPYYQGIEMFMGMRRLQKPAWLLVYNDEAHNLKKIKNKQDLSIRMMQFFDHYLKGKSAPEWMTKGVPRTQKGKDFGYGTDKD